MADKRINDLPALVTQASNDVYEISNNAASLSSKETRAQMLSYMQANITSAVNVLTVAGNGVDAVGRGSILNPFATLNYAISQISDLTTTTVINVYNAQAISNLTVQPNCVIRMNKNPLIVVNSVTLSSAWTSQNGVFALQDSTSLDLPDNVTLDFDDISALGVLFYLENNIISSTTTLTINGSTTAPTLILIDGNFGASNEFNFTETNCYGAISSGATGHVTVVNNNNSTGGNFSIHDLTVIGNLTVICSSNSFNFSQSGCEIIGNSIYESISTGTLNVNVKTMTYFSPPQLDNGLFGGTVNFVADVLAVSPVLLNGATYTPSSLANSILTNYSPVNFTAVNTSVEGAIAGIDNIIGTMLAGISQYIWVNATDGIDAPGRGAENAPYATLDYAYGVVGSPASPVLINVIGDQTTSGDLIIKPNVFINGHNSGVITATISILLDSSWAAGSGRCYIQNCQFAAIGGMQLNFGLGAGNVLILQNNDYGNVLSFFALTDNTVTQPNIIYMLGMNYFSQALQFAIVFSVVDTFLIGDNLTINNLNVSCDGTVAQQIAFVALENCSLIGTVDVNDAGSGPSVMLTLRNTPLPASPTISNSNATLDLDAGSYTHPPTLAGTAVLTQVTIANLADGILQTTFTPSNYTPTAGSNWLADSATGNFAGLDAALSAAGGNVNVTNDDSSTGTPYFPLWVKGDSGSQAVFTSSGGWQWDPGNQIMTLQGSGGLFQFFDGGGNASIQLNRATFGDPAILILGDTSENQTYWSIGMVQFAGANNDFSIFDLLVGEIIRCVSGTGQIQLPTLTASKTLALDSSNNIISLPGFYIGAKGSGATLVGGTVTVSTSAVNTGDLIQLMCTAQGGTPGLGMPVITISNGVSFTITSANVLDTSTFSWAIIKTIP